jgi:hypothetical protein
MRHEWDSSFYRDERGLMQDGAFTGPLTSWGYDKCIIEPGVLFRAMKTGLVYVLGPGVMDDVHYVLVPKLSVGDTFEVDIVHVPTNTILAHKVVMVE